ncbi:MAG: peptidase [Chitinophagaceae bacterium]|nr:MAG: peptidase [Chitinophagaceae bacterium]
MRFNITIPMPFGALAFILLTVLVIYLVRRSAPKRRPPDLVPEKNKVAVILLEEIRFYQRLDEPSRERFLHRVMDFLSTIRITGVGATVEDVDRVMIGASAIIPIFRFEGWQYVNLNEVLLYPETFDEQFRQQGNGRSVLGMVGNGHMQYVMVLSQFALREGFRNKTDKNNTAIHEFVHLVDKTDGDVDGVPEVLVNHQLAAPWMRMMHDQISEIRKGKSDINPYGASSEPEFLAVASEYFFERPELLKEKHPELFAMLDTIFTPHTRKTPAKI